jgi:hypothetical protein
MNCTVGAHEQLAGATWNPLDYAVEPVIQLVKSTGDKSPALLLP